MNLVLQGLCPVQRLHSWKARVGAASVCEATLVPGVWKPASASPSWERGLLHAEMVLEDPGARAVWRARVEET